MINLYYIVKWDAIKEKTWSGTCYSLYHSLFKYCNLLEVELKDVSLWRRIIKRIFIGKDLGRYNILKYRNILSSFFYNKEEVKYCFQFTDIIENTNCTKTFVYQDLSVSFLKYVYLNNQNLFKYSGFGSISMKNLLKREQMEKQYFEKCSGIFTMGKWYRDFLVDVCKIDSNKVFHVGGGVNININCIDYSQKEGNKILFVGRDFKRKGGELVYKAFAFLVKKHPECELHIAGPDKNPIKESLPGYYFYGDCTKDTLSFLFNKCDIFCMPSYFEAYGLVFIEALTYGLPCIGRNAFEMTNFIQEGETGFLINDDNVENLSQKMYHLLKDEKIKENVRNKKDYFVSEYSWDTVAKRITNSINEISRN